MTSFEKIAIIADDYTGAADAGIQFARHGRTVDLLLRPEILTRHSADYGNVALTTESRFLPPEAAAAAVRRSIATCRSAGLGKVFKKIDSTLRGNPGAEIEAALAALDLPAALICTAMPKTGRTCVDGRIFLNGIPLDQSDIGRDPFHPLATAGLADLLRQQTALRIGRLGLDEVEGDGAALRTRIGGLIAGGCRLIIADAVTDRHLAALADQLLPGDLLPVGAGGLAEAMAEVSAPVVAQTGTTSGVTLRAPVIAVVGSLTETSRQQAAHAAASGRFRLVDLDPHMDPDEIRDHCAAEAARAVDDRLNILLKVGIARRPDRISAADGERVAERLGLAAAILAKAGECRTLVSTGGSTSMAIAEALGIVSVHLVDEIMPGVVAGRCHQAGDIEWFISKAGGFGGESLLTDIADRCGAP